MAPQATAPARTDPRLATDLEATWSAAGERGSALVYNISVGGCMMESQGGRWASGVTVRLALPQHEPVEGTIVWHDGRCAGLRFFRPLASEVVARLGFAEPSESFEQLVPRDRFGRTLPGLSRLLPF